jgi:Na+/H+ antiporter NhaB
MKRAHALFLSLAIAVIAIAGVFAATRTVGLGNHARAATDRQIAQRSAMLDRYAASLRRSLRHAVAGTTVRPTAQRPVRIVYHRPPPIVVTTHRTGQHEEAEGGGFDD